VRFLLPPSEAKRDGSDAVALRLDALTAPLLTRDRERVIAALSRHCAKPSPRVRAAIGTTPNQDSELWRNTRLAIAPTAPAHAIYDGVLFDAIGLGTCSETVLKRMVDRVLVQSALLGVVGFGDALPAYRCSADSTLPRLGRIGTFWRARLDGVMPTLLEGHLTLDLRSGPYAAMWQPRGETLERTALVRIMQVRDGKRLALSHANKAAKGRLLRALCELDHDPSSFASVTRSLTAIGFEAELQWIKGRPVIDVITS